jgi:hypothetical protein
METPPAPPREDAREDAREDVGEEAIVEVETLAPNITDDGFVFDWPNEEIRMVCEAMLPKEKDMLPLLNYIPKEIGAHDIDGRRGGGIDLN